MSNRYLVQTPDEPQSWRWEALLSILEDVMPVKFGRSREGQRQFSGELLSGYFPAKVRPDRVDVSSLSVPEAATDSSEGELVELAVRFADDPAVPLPFRGRSIRTKVAGRPKILSLTPGEHALAMCKSGPVWAFSKGKVANHFRSAFPLPFLSAEGSLKDVLNGQRFLEMLPLLHWLRGICARTLDGGPPPRACLMFDDPNLHWPRYGFVNYRQLATQAEKENYHVSFATIPLDTWFTHSGTAEIFRKHQKRLSLLVHGNNHTKRELARSYSEVERLLLLRRAIQRIDRLERQSGLAVSRVMVPPHGACSEEMLAALLACGFEAACISHGSLRAHNKSKIWTRALGYRPFELVRGCLVFPRWGITGEIKNTILLAAYLEQAIILRGHHQDLKDGPELLDELARYINGLGSVEWLNMTDMVRSVYPANLLKGFVDLNGSPLSSFCEEVPRLEVTMDAPFGVASEQSGRRKMRSVTSASFSLIRRLLTEGRDRFLLN
jgi:hypothetical protein